MNKGTWAIVIVVLVVVVLAIWGFTGDNSTTTPADEMNTTTTVNPGGQSTTTTSTPGGDTQPATGTLKEFTVNGSAFAFAPSSLTVKKGDRVRITFRNTGGTHDLKIDEFNAATKVINSGQQETIEFVADKAGAFEYYCSVANHRAMGMRGILTVTE